MPMRHRILSALVQEFFQEPLLTLSASANPSSTVDINDLLPEIVTQTSEELPPSGNCCIYKVPKRLRKVNEEAYTPQVISIGPLHHGNDELKDMEMEKLRYVEEVTERIGAEKLEEFKTCIESNKQCIRNCYAHNLMLPSDDELVTMILHDAVFIIELFLRYLEFNSNNNETISDYLLSQPPLFRSIVDDFTLLENQLPYFILNDLYTIGFANRLDGETYLPFILICCCFFSDGMLKPHHFTANDFLRQVNVKHFTDLRRYHLVDSFRKVHRGTWKTIDADLIPCAVKLHDSGVAFKPSSEDNCLLDIRFEKKKPPRGIINIPWFPVAEMRIPRFEVYDNTESLLRNMMALEQCHYPNETHVCNYVLLMDFLINSEKDVDLLVEKGILSNYLGDNKAMAKMFNGLCKHITVSESYYYDDVSELNAHYNNSWNHAMATLNSVYFCNPWAATGTIVGIIVIVLTVVQTILSLLLYIQSM